MDGLCDDTGEIIGHHVSFLGQHAIYHDSAVSVLVHRITIHIDSHIITPKVT